MSGVVHPPKLCSRYIHSSPRSKKRQMTTNSPTTYQRILQATREGDLENLRSLITAAGTTLHWADCKYKKSGDTPLHVAAREGHLHLLRFLCEECPGVNPEVSNLDGKRPLHEAAQAGRPDVVLYLLSRGVDVDPLKRADWTPLMLACTRSGPSTLATVRSLLAAGADPRLRNKDGWTPLHVAAREGDPAVARCLLAAAPTLATATSRNGRTPLHTAALHARGAVVELLLAAGCPPDPLDSCGFSPLLEAVRSGDVALVQLLALRGAALGRVDASGRGGVHLAAQAGRLPMLTFLVARCGLPVDGRAGSGMSPLHCAAREGQVSAVQRLLKLGADATARDEQGRTVPSMASGSYRDEILHILCKYGAKN
ncbi:ankyrin repeat domain-containing protein 16-like isoform X1 [Hetaerina americana]|uniref:ankyrin repeat domain-containing protein 16-like isoform X1 n=2 Tax=Hetaerina americana TaxID=62018 RepID=UPI003A7F3440